MADKYATIQQHPNMRTPGDWQQMKSFVVQLEEILDDIYRRFGRLRFEDLGTKLQNRLEDDEGNISSIEQTAANISLTVAKKARTFSQASQPTSTSDYTLVAGDLWIDTDDGNKTYRYNGSTWVEVSDANKYSVQSGIDITAEGIDVTGSKYVKIRSGGKFDVDATNFKIDSENKELTLGNLKLNPKGYHVYGQAQIDMPHHYHMRVNKHFVVNDKDDNNYINENLTAGIMHATESTYISSGGTVTEAQINPSIVFYSNGFRQIDSQSSGSYYTGMRLVMDSEMGGKANLYNMAGTFFVGTNNYPATLWGTVQSASSREKKHNIQPMPEMGKRLDRLEPVTFVYNDDDQERTRYGLIYEDAVEVMPEICTAEGESKAINYVELVPMLLREIQSLRKRVAELEGKVYV